MICSSCRMSRVKARGRCEPCYRYWRRTGRDRPAELIARRARQRAELWGLVCLIGEIASA